MSEVCVTRGWTSVPDNWLNLCIWTIKILSLHFNSLKGVFPHFSQSANCHNPQIFEQVCCNVALSLHVVVNFLVSTYLMNFEGRGAFSCFIGSTAYWLNSVHCISKQWSLKIKGNGPTHVSIGNMGRGKFAKMLNCPFIKDSQMSNYFSKLVEFT